MLSTGTFAHDSTPFPIGSNDRHDHDFRRNVQTLRRCQKSAGNAFTAKFLRRGVWTGVVLFELLYMARREVHWVHSVWALVFDHTVLTVTADSLAFHCEIEIRASICFRSQEPRRAAVKRGIYRKGCMWKITAKFLGSTRTWFQRQTDPHWRAKVGPTHNVRADKQKMPVYVTRGKTEDAAFSAALYIDYKFGSPHSNRKQPLLS